MPTLRVRQHGTQSLRFNETPPFFRSASPEQRASRRNESCSGSATMTTQGMIQTAGRTYRIVEVGHATYSAVRIIDEVELGVFRCGSPLELACDSAMAAELGQVARDAIRAGKTRWLGRPRRRATLTTCGVAVLGMILGLASCRGELRSMVSSAEQGRMPQHAFSVRQP